MSRRRVCSLTEHERIKADPVRWRTEMHDHKPWPGVGEMANHHCNSTLLREQPEAPR